jgi:excisionase family DNA binding protein
MIKEIWRIKMDNEILTIQQAAEFLQVCDKTVRRLISKKELPASKIGGSWRVKKSDIDEYLLQTRNK